MASDFIGTCQVCGRQHGVDNTGKVQRHKAEATWVDAPEFCPGSEQPPYQFACAAMAEARINVMRQADTLALEHLNTAVTENLDSAGRSWCLVHTTPNAFRPVGGALWMLGRIMQTETGVVQLLDANGHLHKLPQYKTVLAARLAMLAQRLAVLDSWHQAALQRAEWYKLKIAAWHPGKLQRRAPRGAPVSHRATVLHGD
jgi:hypothetical protein